MGLPLRRSLAALRQVSDFDIYDRRLPILFMRHVDGIVAITFLVVSPQTIREE